MKKEVLKLYNAVSLSSQGIMGAAGIKGPQGERGASGPPGFPGSKGQLGPSGPEVLQALNFFLDPALYHCDCCIPVETTDLL